VGRITIPEQARPNFDELLRRTYQASSRLAFKIVGDAEVVGDVLQDAYLNVYRGLERFREDARYETWVYRIVANASFGHLRKYISRKERECSIEELPENVGETPGADSSVLTLDLVALLGRIPQEMRHVLLLRYGCGYSIRQIADEDGVSEAAVKVRLHRARHRLAELSIAVDEAEFSSSASR